MKIFKNLCVVFVAVVLCLGFVSCKSSGNNNQSGNSAVAEKVTLEKSVINEVEFENSKSVKIDQDSNIVTVSGTIDAMSDSQKSVFNEESSTHVVCLKFAFDKERTLSKFEIKGSKSKVFADDKNVENYAGKISDLFDSEPGEDAYSNLVLSANVNEYSLISTYTDGTKSTIKLKIVATLATATAE